jgi:hypothetical protein
MGEMTKKHFFILLGFASLFLFLFSFPLVQAAPEPRTSIISSNGGIEISYPYNEYIDINKPYYVRWWVYNKTSGQFMSNFSGNASCTYKLMDTNGKNILEYNDTSSNSIWRGW